MEKHDIAARQAGLLARLGLHGLAHLDAPILAALASETPLLLIGPHGTAKSALFARLAMALGLVHRHYNASLVSFDDIVGFPVPDGNGVRYLHTPATLWGARSIFFDEISRCRPETQNKLFSIVHEKAVLGVALEGLRYRWAAMNPPASDDALEDLEEYIGSQPLDPALADRFGFVLALPALEELAPEARRAVIRSGLVQDESPASFPELQLLIEACRRHARRSMALRSEWVIAYVAALLAPLHQAGLTLSGRRAALLAGNITGVHGACQALGEHGYAREAGLALEDAAHIALRHSLPQRALGKPVEASVIASIHRRAAEAATGEQGDPALARMLDEIHPVKRVGQALALLKSDGGKISRHTMSLLVADALASQDKQARWILSQEILPDVAELDCVDASTLELLTEPFREQVWYEDHENRLHEVPHSRMAAFNELVSVMDALDAEDPSQVALGNLGAALYARDESAADPGALLQQRARLRTLLDGAVDHAS